MNLSGKITSKLSFRPKGKKRVVFANMVLLDMNWISGMKFVLKEENHLMSLILVYFSLELILSYPITLSKDLVLTVKRKFRTKQEYFKIKTK